MAVTDINGFQGTHPSLTCATRLRNSLHWLRLQVEHWSGRGIPYGANLPFRAWHEPGALSLAERSSQCVSNSDLPRANAPLARVWEKASPLSPRRPSTRRRLLCCALMMDGALGPGLFQC